MMLGQPTLHVDRRRWWASSLTGADCARASTATDMTSCFIVTEMLREKGVVGKFVEFYGDGRRPAARSPTAPRIANMAPEYGATMRLLPRRRADPRVHAPHRPRRGPLIQTVEAVLQAPRACGATGARGRSEFTDTARTSTSATVAAGPGRPEAPAGSGRRCRRCMTSRIFALTSTFGRDGGSLGGGGGDGGTAVAAAKPATSRRQVASSTTDIHFLSRGRRRWCIAAITSVHQHLQPGRHARRRALLAKQGRRATRASPRKPWVKTSLAPGSPCRHRVPTSSARVARRPGRHRLQRGRLRLHHLHWQLGSAPRGHREDRGRPARHGRVELGALGQPQLRRPGPQRTFKASYLALAAARRRLRASRARSTSTCSTIPSARTANGNDVYPQATSGRRNSRGPGHHRVLPLASSMFQLQVRGRAPGAPTSGDSIDTVEESEPLSPGQDREHLRAGACRASSRAFVPGPETPIAPDRRRRAVLLKLGDSVTTDHISPGRQDPRRTALRVEYLVEAHGVAPKSLFNSFGSRRGNHERHDAGHVRERPRIRNQIVKSGNRGRLDDRPTCPPARRWPIYDASA